MVAARSQHGRRAAGRPPFRLPLALLVPTASGAAPRHREEKRTYLLPFFGAVERDGAAKHVVLWPQTRGSEPPALSSVPRPPLLQPRRQRGATHVRPSTLPKARALTASPGGGGVCAAGWEGEIETATDRGTNDSPPLASTRPCCCVATARPVVWLRRYPP